MAILSDTPTLEEEPRLSTEELAQRWRVSEATLRSWRAKGTGPKYIRLGGSIRYHLADVLDFERDHTVEPNGAP